MCAFLCYIIQELPIPFLVVCLENSRIFHSFGDVTITGEGVQMTYARALRTLSSEGSLACDIRLYWSSVYNGHLRGPVTLAPNSERLALELSLPVLTT